MKLGLLSTALLAVVAVPAMAEGWMPSMPKETYASVKGGWAIPQDMKFTGADTSLDNGFFSSAAVGGRIANVRGEVEALYTRSDADSINGVGAKGDTALTAGMVNGYYDFKNSSFFTPYVGAGVGYGHLKFKGESNGTTRVNGSDGVLAYQGIAGVAYEINPCWSVTGEYRYIGTTDADVRTNTGVTSNSDFQSHNLIAGLKYSF